MHDQQFQQLLNSFELSWNGYRKVRKGVKKRISRHMLQLGHRNLSSYLSVLAEKEQERKKCEQLLTVSISRFFRDLCLWQTLGNEILPALIQTEKEKIKIWSAGCACGEEVYSFRIVWDRVRIEPVQRPKLEITATDLNPVYIQKAQAGIYPASSLKELPAEIKSRYFDPIKGKSLYAVKPFLKDHITWQAHNLLSDPPGLRYHIIFLRNNLLTYYRKHLTGQALLNILNSLAPGGILIIGSHEKLPFIPASLTQFAEYSTIFKKKFYSADKTA